MGRALGKRTIRGLRAFWPFLAIFAAAVAGLLWAVFGFGL